MQCIRVNNLLRITECLNSLTFSTRTLVLPSLDGLSCRVYAAEQNGEMARMVSNWKYTRSQRTLTHSDVTDDKRCCSCSGGATCVPHQLHIYYKWLLWFNHQTVFRMEENGKLDQGEQVWYSQYNSEK